MKAELNRKVQLLCACERASEKDHVHHRRTGRTTIIHLPDGTPKEIPETVEELVKGAVPIITMQPIEVDYETGRLELGGRCARCREVFTCTMQLDEGGLREAAPKAEDRDGEPDPD